MNAWNASAEDVGAAGASGVVKVEPAPFLGELEPAYRRWVACPGEMLSVLDNITDLGECMKRVGANATVAIGDLSLVLRGEDETLATWTQGAGSLIEAAANSGAQSQVYLGERNNPYFTYLPEAFRQKHPEAFMRDASNQPIEIVSNPIRNVRNPVPAVDDATVVRLASQFIERDARALAAHKAIRAWTIGSEEAYPDYFALPVGDFREASLRHYEAFAAARGLPSPCDPSRVLAAEDSAMKAAWYLFREQAIADRASAYMRSFLTADQTRPVLYPTHGHPFAGDMRRKLGQPPSLIAGACDGFEMGHILINDDDERLNLLYLCNYTAFGVPVTVPRLGNKTLVPTARGGGKSFTPAMLRRLIYECVGMGAWHIGPIHWRAILGDGEWAIKDTPAEAECAAVFGEIRRARPILAGMSRLQPQVGLYVSDDTWLKEWNPKWTAFVQDAFAAHWNVTVVNDALLSSDLAPTMPLLVSIDNARLSGEAREGLQAYLDAGGQILAWGTFGAEGPLGHAVAGIEERAGLRLRREANKTDAPARNVVNRFQTGDGAWEWPHAFAPIPFSEVEAAARQAAPRALVKPIDVASPDPGKVEVFVLTDGWSLGAVVVNHDAAPCEAELRPDRRLLPSGKAWKAVSMLEPGQTLSTDAGHAKVTLPAHGSALVWFRPEIPRAEAQAAVEVLKGVVATWRQIGCDTASTKRALESAVQSLSTPGLEAKAWCLAREAQSSLCLKPTVLAAADGGLSISVEVRDASGLPVRDAGVSVRLVPDAFRRRVLSRTGEGTYALTVPKQDMPRTYDFEKRCYAPLYGPLRVVFLARSGRGQGGAMSTVTIPEESH